MEPFAQQPRSAGTRKMILLALAGVSFSIWYFDLFPELGSVPTGELDSASTSEKLDEAEFIAMLESAPAAESADADASAEPRLPPLSEDPLIAALAAQSEPGDDSGPGLGTMAAVPATAGHAGSEAGEVQQASFEISEPEQPESLSEPAILPAEIAAELRQVDQWIKDGETLNAHAALSRLYWKQPDARGFIQQRIEQTSAEIYANPATHFAEPYMVEFGDTLEKIAKQYKVPWQYLGRLNRVTPKTLQAGQQLKVLTGPFGAVVDLDDFALTIHAHGWFVRRYQIGIGADQKTPVGEFTVREKLENPTWYNPDGGVIEADDPTNPLGEYWLGLGDHIGIHGTIDPDSIGRAASRGCIHLADGDIGEVFYLLGVDSPVVIRQ
ncbi:MAG: L,D-transpeptidase family protein [Fuerstiella sp.]